MTQGRAVIATNHGGTPELDPGRRDRGACAPLGPEGASEGNRASVGKRVTSEKGSG